MVVNEPLKVYEVTVLRPAVYRLECRDIKEADARAKAALRAGEVLASVYLVPEPEAA